MQRHRNARRLIPAILFVAATATAQTPPPADSLVAELGCRGCHTDLPNRPAIDLRQRAPDLSSAGRLYLPGWLFDYLQHPTRIRRHIGRSRMPDFRFSEREALALTLYLQQQTRLAPGLPDPANALQPGRQQERIGFQMEPRRLIHETGCLQCHTLGGEGTGLSFDLSIVGRRIRPEAVASYIAAPAAFGVPERVMPALLFSLRPDSSGYISRDRFAYRKVQIISEYFIEVGKKARERLQKNFEKAKRANPDITAAMGARIYDSQNCSACHKLRGSRSWTTRMAPDLSDEGNRVRRDWLRNYLDRPQAIRPFGFLPGTGSRMPDFQLQKKESEALTDWLLRRKRRHDRAFAGKPLSAFAMAKARKLLSDKLSCLGCHRLGGQGGRIGPDLSSLSRRLQPGYVRRIVENPQQASPGTVMPKVPMFPVHKRTAPLIIGFLLQQSDSLYPGGDLSLVDTPLIFPDDAKDETEKQYLTYCAACHGPRGEADGFNAKYLPKPPTRFADADYLSKRPDDTLFDGIYSGGYILNKSQMMPPWGKTLSVPQMQALVRHLRKLCGCTAPAWSRDGR